MTSITEFKDRLLSSESRWSGFGDWWNNYDFRSGNLILLDLRAISSFIGSFIFIIIFDLSLFIPILFVLSELLLVISVSIFIFTILLNVYIYTIRINLIILSISMSSIFGNL